MSALRQATREIFLLLAVSALTAVATWALHPDANDWRNPPAEDPLGISLREVKGLPDPVLWVDARPLAQFEAGHISGAIPLNEDAWDEHLVGFLDQWKPGSTVVVYCSAETCNASRSVAQRLREEMAIDSAFFLEGGWDAWQEAEGR